MSEINRWLNLTKGIRSGNRPNLFSQDHDVYKKRLDSNGAPLDEGEKHEIGPHTVNQDSYKNGSFCGSCYGAGMEGECCDTCEEVHPSGLKLTLYF